MTFRSDDQTCRNCIKLTDKVCEVYRKPPPVSFALKCKHYDQVADENLKHEWPACNERCFRYDKDDVGEWCLRTDHPDFRYNFVKIKPGIVCPLED